MAPVGLILCNKWHPLFKIPNSSPVCVHYPIKFVNSNFEGWKPSKGNISTDSLNSKEKKILFLAKVFLRFDIEIPYSRKYYYSNQAAVCLLHLIYVIGQLCTYRAGQQTQECQEFRTFSANSGMSGISHLFAELRNVKNFTPFKLSITV